MRISPITTNFEKGVCRVSAGVDGAPLWFESADAALNPSPEAFASAMLVPAIDRGERLTLEEPVSSVWRSSVRQALSVFNQWWGYPELLPEPVHHPPEATRAAQTALLFTGGVDSFHTLLRSGYAIKYLVYALGFDIPLNDDERFKAFEPSLRAIAAATGATAVVIRTNLREHPAFAPVSWERTHGGALAALGHLLSGGAGQLLISASQTHSQTTPWGSHWLTDRFWSSERLQIINLGGELNRYDKLREIAAEPLARHGLRICWENLAPTGNCSRCEKCVRTRLVLAECGELEKYSVLDGAGSLLEDLNALPHSNGIQLTYREMLESSRIDGRMKRAIRRLIARDDKFLKRRQRIEGRRKRLRQAGQWLKEQSFWRKLPWRLRSWIDSRIRLSQ